MKRIRKNQNLKQGQKVNFDMYADGSLTSVEAEVTCDSGELVSVYYFHPLYPEAGRQLKCLNKKQLYIIK
jgi:hypothetical protein